jgi:hypothetical protein
LNVPENDGVKPLVLVDHRGLVDRPEDFIESKHVAGIRILFHGERMGTRCQRRNDPRYAHSPSARLNWDAFPSMVTVKVPAVPNLQTLSCAVSSVVAGTGVAS